MGLILGWLGNLLFAIGAYGLAKKQVYGFQCQFVANLLYVIQSYLMNNPPLLWLSIGLGLFNLYGIWEWNKNDKPEFNQAEKAYAEAVCDLYKEE